VYGGKLLVTVMLTLWIVVVEMRATGLILMVGEVVVITDG